MSSQNIPVVDLGEWQAGGAAQQRFIKTLGEGLTDTGFFAVRNHGITDALVKRAYDAAKLFFHLPSELKSSYSDPAKKGQRGFTGLGKEHARDAKAADLKEFWQVGRPGWSHPQYGDNPDVAEVPDFIPTLTELYRGLDALGGVLLQAAALYIDEPLDRFSSLATQSDTIVRVLYYPPIGPEVPAGAVRSAAHEDINFITLLSGATSEGLELLRRDGTWMPVHTGFDTLVVDAGDMLQNITTGLYTSTTHRVVNPGDSTSERFSMPSFVHARSEVDLSPLPSCVARTGGAAKYPRLTAGEYLDQRLREIGLG
jgi:isopenicillin N synthase-like dioxygenase